jgi:hypothetical protein
MKSGNQVGHAGLLVQNVDIFKKLKTAMESLDWNVNVFSEEKTNDVIFIDRSYHEETEAQYLETERFKGLKVFFVVSEDEWFDILTNPLPVGQTVNDIWVLRHLEDGRPLSVISAEWGEMTFADLLEKNIPRKNENADRWGKAA